ncbi:hypothetical protein SAMN06297387_12863 [Streptomyces zhaozhouensis]|uniref:Uncharacterized protein n=1 Tax=Streptomyces zhaozhouensis TaxID=1300267 RepID=A0A286E853_9ACTN|nr:hypothetical protein [Streptomyces zhaozhouensis]SOD67095.1 hypothetical protein SAMN06297387_12863 [Streptomyces zhaozhouensis]
MTTLLVWRDASHYDHRGPRPCTICHRPTPLRSHRGEPAHKTCAETWAAAHPNEIRFISDATTNRRDADDHA